jgi:Ca2+-binding EF-hand superfamily protein
MEFGAGRGGSTARPCTAPEEYYGSQRQRRNSRLVPTPFNTLPLAEATPQERKDRKSIHQLASKIVERGVEKFHQDSMRELFRRFDRHHRGRISVDDLREGCRELSIDVDLSDADGRWSRIFSSVDPGGRGTIDYVHFSTMIEKNQYHSELGTQSELVGEHCIKRYRSHFLPSHGQMIAAKQNSEKRTKGKKVFMMVDKTHHRSTLLDWYTRKDLSALNEQVAAGDLELFTRIEEKLRNHPRLHSTPELVRVFASYDYTDDGLITGSEFRDGLKLLGLMIPDHEFGRLIAHVDAGRSGLIDYKAFAQATASGALHSARQDITIDDDWVTTSDAVTTYDVQGGAHRDKGKRMGGQGPQWAASRGGEQGGKDLWQPDIQRGGKPQRARRSRPMLLSNAKRLNAVDWQEPARPTGSRPQPHRSLDMKVESIRDREQAEMRKRRAYDEWGRVVARRPDNPHGTVRGPPPLREQYAMAQKREEERQRRWREWQQ